MRRSLAEETAAAGGHPPGEVQARATPGVRHDETCGVLDFSQPALESAKHIQVNGQHLEAVWSRLLQEIAEGQVLMAPAESEQHGLQAAHGWTQGPLQSLDRPTCGHFDSAWSQGPGSRIGPASTTGVIYHILPESR